MADLTLSPVAPSPVAASSGDVREERSTALYDVLRLATSQHALLRWTIGPVLCALSWLNRRFWAARAEQLAANGKRPTWMSTLLCGWYMGIVTDVFGPLAEDLQERRIARLPKDHAHAVPAESRETDHLPLYGIPMTMQLGNNLDVVEFRHSGDEVHVHAGDATACMWLIEGAQAGEITMTNHGTPVTDVRKRGNRLELRSGRHDAHLTLPKFAQILEMLQDGAEAVWSDELEYTSISGDDARTIRFELLP